jgi:hypothetical protein
MAAARKKKTRKKTSKKKAPRKGKGASRPMGRPSVMTAAVQKRILASVRKGHYLETAAANSGVSAWTVRVWLRRGGAEYNRLQRKKDEREQGYEVADDELEIQEGLKRYVDFFTAYEKADAEGEAKMLGRIDRAGAKHWQATAWRLERRKPERYARPSRVEHTGKDGGPIDTRGFVVTPETLKNLDDDELAVVKKLIAGTGT